MGFLDNMFCMLYACISIHFNTVFVNWWDINVEKEKMEEEEKEEEGGGEETH